MRIDSVISALSLVRRAGKLEIGYDAAEKAVKKKLSSVVVITEDISERTKRGITAALGGTSPLQLPLTQDDIEKVFRKRFVVAAITDSNLGRLLQNTMEKYTSENLDIENEQSSEGCQGG